METNNHEGENQSSVSPAGNREQIPARNIAKLFVTFYHVSREEFSPAEGGCWFDYYRPVLCIPLMHIPHIIYPTRWADTALWSDADDDMTSQAKDLVNLYAEDVLGLTLETTIIDGRKALPIYSACWQNRADARWHIEEEPMQSRTIRWPHYE